MTISSIIDTCLQYADAQLLRCQSAILGNRCQSFVEVVEGRLIEPIKHRRIKGLSFYRQLGDFRPRFLSQPHLYEPCVIGRRFAGQELHRLQFLCLIGNEGGVDSQLVCNRYARDTATLIELVDGHQDQPLWFGDPQHLGPAFVNFLKLGMDLDDIPDEVPYGSIELFFFGHVGLSAKPQVSPSAHRRFFISGNACIRLGPLAKKRISHGSHAIKQLTKIINRS